VRLTDAGQRLDAALRPGSDVLSHTSLDRTALWAQGISGDLPIIVARINEPSSLLIKLEKEAEVVLEQARAEAAAQSRRQAVLEGLAKLGYQVSENLETAWVQDGRVVIKRTSQPGYGVELSGKMDSGRVQMRTVAIRSFRSSVDSARARQGCGNDIL